MKKILIYQDEGADCVSVQSLLQALQQKRIDRSFEIGIVNSTALRARNWQKNCRLVIFPGGRDIPYHRALQGEGNRNLREFVENGGRYFGICAGAYYGSATVDFERGGPLEVLEDRELQFFPGTACGPAYGLRKFNYQSEQGARIAQLSIGSAKFAAYFNGGCTFVEPEEHPRVTVIARYADLDNQPAAIVRCKVGEGIAILSGVHPEYAVLPELELFQTLLDQLLCTET